MKGFHMINVYVGCGLTQAPLRFRKAVDSLKEKLRSHANVYNFMGLFDGTPEEVYRRDIGECVADCDAFIAISDFPSMGLGYELGVAVEKLRKPTLSLAHRDSKISRLIIGIAQPHYQFARYASTKERFDMCLAFIRKVEASRND